MRRLNEGEFGPGTQVKATFKDKNWKGIIGAIENKNRPESIYITVNTWVKPQLSVVQAQAQGEENPEILIQKIISAFIKELDKSAKKIPAMFDSKFFEPSSVIFTYDFAEGGVKPGKRSFLEFEINIDTVNEIDWEGMPAPSKSTGRINHMPFKDFVKPATAAINKVLMMDVFAKSSLSFAASKGAK